jgi:hypothetical protein
MIREYTNHGAKSSTVAVVPNTMVRLPNPIAVVCVSNLNAVVRVPTNHFPVFPILVTSSY